MVDFEALLHHLTGHSVEFIIVGGAAAVVHGSSHLTQDLDIVYRRTPENIRRLVTALGGWKPYLRGAPPGLPFEWSERTITRGLNFTLSTEVGPIDIFGEIVGGGTYEQLLPHSVEIEVFGTTCRCLDLKALIRAKRAAGRPKDLAVLAELEAILEEQQGAGADQSEGS